MEKLYYSVFVAVYSLERPEETKVKLEKVARLRKPQAKWTCYDSYNDRDVTVFFRALHWYEDAELPFIVVPRNTLRVALERENLFPYRKS